MGYAVSWSGTVFPVSRARRERFRRGRRRHRRSANRTARGRRGSRPVRRRDRFGRIDTLINNAGIYIGKPFTEYTFDEYEAITAVNLTGFFRITQLAIAEMVARGSGHVVNISTSLVDNADSTRPSALPALTKGGLVAASRSLAIEYASRGVRVNAVSLGVIKTPDHDPASYEGLEALHPLGRVGEVSDVVDAILYLERATFVTGETLHVDGGQAAGR